jgi:hypothetical protein
VPLALLATRAGLGLAHKPGARQIGRRFAPAALLLVAALVNVYLLGWRFVDLARHRAPYYLHRDEVAALAWLDHQAGEGVVLSDETLGQYVPALAGKRAVLAHWAQTVDYYAKRGQVARFFDPGTPADERATILRRYRVEYVLAGEADLPASTRSPLDQPALAPVFESPNAVVYRVR